MTRFRPPSPYLAGSAAFASAVVTLLAAVLTQAAETDFAPAARDDFPTEVFWGDTHVHSSFSVDANSMGNTRLSPADAYRFAKGEAVVANNGMTARLEAPLDFLVVSDHAEYMGLLPALRAGNEALLSDPVGRRLSEAVQGDQASQYAVIQEIIGSLMASAPIIDNADFKQSIWNEITRLADEANEPGRFSAMIGYEWSAMPSGDNLHRVVVYRDGADEAKQKAPRSSFEGEDPESLWAFMEDYVAETGGDILFIEATSWPGTGEGLKLTGQLGQVMKESVETALSLIRSRTTDWGVDPAVFKDATLHVHVPAGGIPKDGPSAGITMVTAVLGMLTGRLVRPHLAMTGEITLRGKVLPVGGIKEKVLAARRAGVTEVLLPRRNETDLEDVPPALLKELRVHLVDHIDEVLAIALEAPAT